MSAVDWVTLAIPVVVVGGMAIVLTVLLWRWHKLTPDQRDWAQGRVPISILEALVARGATERPGEGDGTGSGPVEAHRAAEGYCDGKGCIWDGERSWCDGGCPLPERAAAVAEFRTALLTGLDGLQRHGQFKLVDPEDVGELVARVAQEVGRG